MNSALLASTFDSIENFLATLADALQFDVLLYIFIGLFALLVIMTIIRLRFTYEVRAIRSFKKINKYFLKKPYINESNLVEFNRLMKKIPYQLRDRWQYFMLNREGLPSSYMTLYHCVEQPIKTSNYRSTIVMLKYICSICVVLCTLLSLFLIAGTLTGKSLVQALIIPMGFFILSQLYIYFLNAKFNAVSVDLYEYYLAFIRNLDKASASIPDYVDYELLFTDKEIRDGIPVLREYLEKRALLDKLAREKAKQNESERESFDFTNLGIDGSLLVERAMTTSQDYLNTRNRLKDEITKLEAEKDKYDAQYISVEKDSQRKLQAIKENLDRLQAQLDASANRIEANYIKKQQSAEKAKQAEIDKNLEDLHVKYAQQVQFLEAEIAKRKEAIEADKKDVSEQMDAEFATYNEKVYTILRNKIDQDDADELKVTRAELDSTRDKLASETQEKDNLKLTLDIKGQEIDTMQSKIDALNDKIAKLTSRDRRNIAKMYDENIELKKRVAELEEQTQNQTAVAVENAENVDAETAAEEDGEPVYYDANHNIVDFSQYYDENGWFKEFPKVYDADGNYYDFADYYDKYGNPLEQTEESAETDEANGNTENVETPVKDAPVETAENVENAEFAETANNEQAVENASVVEENETPAEESQTVEQEAQAAEPVFDENAAQGQPMIETQTTEEKIEQPQTISEAEIAPREEVASQENEQAAENAQESGEVVDESASVDENANAEDAQNDLTTAEIPADREEDMDDGDVVYYDKDGKPVDFEKYYDENGRFKEFPKVYDKDGNYYDFADYYDRDGNLLGENNEVSEDDIVPISVDEENEVIDDEPKNVETVEKSSAEHDAANTVVADEKPAKRGRGRPKKTESDDDKPKKRRATRVASDEKPATAKKTTSKSGSKSSAAGSKSGTKATAKSKTTATNGKSKSAAKNSATTQKSSAKKTTSKAKSGEKVEKKTATKKPSTKSNAKNKPTTTKKRVRKTPKDNEVKKTDEELDKLNGQINSENAILEAKQADLKKKISQTLSELQEKPTVDRDLEEIKEIMNRLKEQAAEAKKNGASEEEQKQINRSLGELLLAMANKQNSNK